MFWVSAFSESLLPWGWGPRKERSVGQRGACPVPLAELRALPSGLAGARAPRQPHPMPHCSVFGTPLYPPALQPVAPALPPPSAQLLRRPPSQIPASDGRCPRPWDFALISQTTVPSQCPQSQCPRCQPISPTPQLSNSPTPPASSPPQADSTILWASRLPGPRFPDILVQLPRVPPTQVFANGGCGSHDWGRGLSRQLVPRARPAMFEDSPAKHASGAPLGN